MRVRETIDEKLKRCGASIMADQPHTYWNGIVGWSHSILKLGRKSYPLQFYLEVRQGHDRVKTVASLSWAEARRLHDELELVLKNRAKLEKKIKNLGIAPCAS